MTESKKRKCPHCGANMVLYPHTLGRGVVNALVRFAALGKGPQRPVEKGYLVNGMSYNQGSNFQKLGYFGLVAKVPPERSGVWEVTRWGWEFIAGELRVPRKVWTYRGVVDHFEDDLVRIADTKHEAFYMQFEDYVAESVGVGP